MRKLFKIFGFKINLFSDLKLLLYFFIYVFVFKQEMYPQDWKNFLERVDMINDSALVYPNSLVAQQFNKSDKAEYVHLEMRLWASYRGQTLARTVRGMMYHEQALRLQALWEEANYESKNEDSKSEFEIKQTLSGLDGDPILVSGAVKSKIEQKVKLKFLYVVTCQIFGKQRSEGDPKAKDIEWLMAR